LPDDHFAVSPDALLSIRGEGWVLSNPRTRRHCELDSGAVTALARTTAPRTEAEWIEALADGTGWDRTRFSAADGLWSDPTGIADRRARGVSGSELFRLLRQLLLIQQADGSDYRVFLAPLSSILDRAHLGTFNERVGQLQANLRVRDKWRWWHDQKFTPDGLAVRDGPYKFVQERFFDRYFASQNLEGRRILDFACGNGYYAAKFARMGARVIGLDTSAELIDIARRNFGSAIQFEAPSTVEESLSFLHSLEPGSIDLIYMSDVMLFLVDNIRLGADRSDLERLLAAFRRIIADGGRVQMMEPNALFWLGGLYGGADTPYVIVPEYRNPLYNVAPTPDVMINTIAGEGFCLVELVHPELGDDAEVDSTLRARALGFPLWDLFTFVKSGGPRRHAEAL
jgi:SAM-dependent methyltransferase